MSWTQSPPDRPGAHRRTARRPRDRFFILSGCSGGGKSTLLDALAALGFPTVPEPGRRIVQGESDPQSPRLPWNDMAGFARAALACADADYRRATGHEGPVFFDRGLVDAAVALSDATGVPLHDTLGNRPCYARTVFLVPPWPEIHVRDDQRRHGFRTARAEYQRLSAAYPALGYRVIIVPRTTVARRVAFVLRHVARAIRDPAA